MSRRWISLTLFAVSAIGLSVAFAVFGASAQSAEEPDDAARVDRGRYLVHDVAMCVQCHSTRTQNGELSDQAMLHGGPVPVRAPGWSPEWASTAPDLTTIARERPDYMIQVLTTGQRPDGSSPLRPMPPFRLSDEDARSVVSYLKTVK